MYSAPSPYDEPTKPIDVRTLRAWWVHHQRKETQAIGQWRPKRTSRTLANNSAYPMIATSSPRYIGYTR
jgi:hypothetical protein